MSPSVMSAIDATIERPLDAIQDLFSKNWTKENASESNDFGVAAHFQELFDTREKLLQIPSLDAQSVQQLPVHSLVRFRCMVQDTDLSQEIALFSSIVTTQPDGEEKLVCHRYSDGPQQDNVIECVPDQDIMDLRNSYYCVSVPGVSAWAKEYDNAANQLSLEGLTLDGDDAPQVIPGRYPFPRAQHFAAVVKTHASDINIGVTDMVDVIGVLGASNSVISGDSFDFNEESSDSPRVPTVHAITMRKVDDHGHPDLGINGQPSKSDMDACLQDAAATRRDLMAYLTDALKGDELAAELVLLHMLARVYARAGGKALGQFSLNLKQTELDTTLCQTLEKIMSNILPKVHAIPMTLQTLNTEAFYPRKDDQLLSGFLQVTRGTTLVLDETALEEGTLNEQGLKNLRAVSGVSQNQTLSYMFPFNSIDFNTDISLLIVSLGSSLVPVDCAITLNPDTTRTEPLVVPSADKIEAFRKYVSVLRLAEYTVSEEVAKEIETDFVEQRKAANAAKTTPITPDEFAFNISLARIVSLSKGEISLSMDSWEQAVSLAKQIGDRK
ncbi:hypothetical protein EMPS_06031 [Entomortierella parvispora]|uniref:Mini-chromosome maintenance complex-binding protein n=1 Tax=Entomortierella parvispora TaxID=205924 RepID=A0A9P3LX24_9FUNG|nr:hypothetical protein EMPS_06031 [Entomortierella parvispora]